MKRELRGLLSSSYYSSPRGGPSHGLILMSLTTLGGLAELVIDRHAHICREGINDYIRSRFDGWVDGLIDWGTMEDYSTLVCIYVY
jgi:hypothetical protein